MPPNDTMKNCCTARCGVKCPVITAAKAKRNTIKLLASFTRLSPSRIVVARFGMCTPLSTEVAATASGGLMMPPSRKPKPRVKPGMSQVVKYPTTREVKNTNPKASMLMLLLHRQNSRHEVNQAAS